MSHQPSLIPTEPKPDHATRDAERAAYLERLRQHLQDPAFHQIEGFPLGDDEAILALSDPPYYTACPNPFLAEIIEKWQREREVSRGAEEQGSRGEKPHASRITHHAPATPDSSIDGYHREPFAADVSEGKNDPIYNAHSYHTKVPHKAIMRYILHYTEPGDIVFDGFCGTGMTGVAAQLCGDKKEVESLGYFVDEDRYIYDRRPPTGQKAEEQESRGAGGKSLPRSPAPLLPISKLGPRKAVLCDLSPAATFIACNYNTPVDVAAFEIEAKRILAEVEAECGWMYETLHTDGKTKGKINYTVWSDIFVCPQCSEELVLWNVAVDQRTRKVKEEFTCPKCGIQQTKSNLERAQETVYDTVLGQTIKRAKQLPVLINYNVGASRYEKLPDTEDLEVIKQVEVTPIPYWFPTRHIDEDIDLWYERDYRSLGIFTINSFYTKRNLYMTAYLWHHIRQTSDVRLRDLLLCWVQSVTLGFSKLNRYRKDGYSQVNQILSGTLYVGSFIAEISPWYALKGKITRMAAMTSGAKTNLAIISTCSTTSANLLPVNSLDYIFVDPPFGSNIIYSDLSIIWEAWLRLFTNPKREAVVHRRKKSGHTLTDYQNMMSDAFTQMYVALKPGRWITVEFHNTQNSVWNAIQESMLHAGFVIADVRTMDKQLATFKQVTASGAVKQDLIISAYKPTTDFEQGFLAEGGREKGAWEFIRQHLEQLPIVVERPASASDSALALEIIAERQAYLLYDRMVAFHIQRGFSVPLSAAEFYAGLKQRFPERDGMYFLPTQAAEYDQRRLRASKVEQLALFVTDEKSALQWLQRELDPETGSGPQTYQDLQPKFLRELHQARHEKLPELRHLLEENFLQDEQERWFIPNPERQEHLEQLREKSLLREFQDYATSKGRLKIFRTEAVRAGFKRAWADKNYRLIVQIAQRLPESVLQEDPGLLMYYDNALMRVEKEPRQLEF